MRSRSAAGADKGARQIVIEAEAQHLFVYLGSALPAKRRVLWKRAKGNILKAEIEQFRFRRPLVVESILGTYPSDPTPEPDASSQ